MSSLNGENIVGAVSCFSNLLVLLHFKRMSLHEHTGTILLSRVQKLLRCLYLGQQHESFP